MDIAFEPFRIKSVELITPSTRSQPLAWLEEAGYNVFLLLAEQVMVDLLQLGLSCCCASLRCHQHLLQGAKSLPE
jgi:tryptophanase